MLFRYKITKRYNYFYNDQRLIHYDTKIQKYSPNNVAFKWKTCTDTTLKSIVEILSKEYCFFHFENALQEITETIAKYGSVDKMIYEYIRKIIIRDMQRDDKLVNIEKTLDNIVLTNGWNTIEIKENE